MTDSMENTVVRFRTAVGGFHKGDVTEYISRTAAVHKETVAKLQKELDRLELENESLRARCLAMEAELAANYEASAERETETLEEQELAAYRRAEAAERLANQRAKKFYLQMEEVAQSVGEELTAAAKSAEDSLNAVVDQVNLLRQAKKQLDLSLMENMEKLAVMSAMVPDPAEGLEEV